ncbi:hypothetical protein AMC83_CH00376 [Rhizobium phaseoli]|uniref:hypothetical protein n=1 Tax=Rhizobium phaseoli TaxID=396 RepID=UPI0007EAAA7E|nr:hypothetical protein [Rhizobium phaseoli]ANL70414.1 hypothetical protein AMC83_CH00376 [Rhizobium phaseoli]
MFQFRPKPAARLRFTIAVTVSISLAPLQVSAVELDKMFDSLEPAYTTMAGAEVCHLKLEIGPRLWRYAEMRVRALESRSGLSNEQLSAKKETAKAEGRQVAGIGACGSVLVAFQVLDELRKAAGQPYPHDDATFSQTQPSPRSAALEKQQDVSSLVNEWTDAYIACRGGFGDEESTSAACGKRDEIAEKLAGQGYCGERSPDGSPVWSMCASSQK